MACSCVKGLLKAGRGSKASRNFPVRHFPTKSGAYRAISGFAYKSSESGGPLLVGTLHLSQSTSAMAPTHPGILLAHRKRDIYALSPSAQTANAESNVTSFLNIFLRAKLRFVIFATNNLLMQKQFDMIKLLVVLHSPNTLQQIDFIA